MKTIVITEQQLNKFKAQALNEININIDKPESKRLTVAKVPSDKIKRNGIVAFRSKGFYIEGTLSKENSAANIRFYRSKVESRDWESNKTLSIPARFEPNGTWVALISKEIPPQEKRMIADFKPEIEYTLGRLGCDGVYDVN